jgi:hypothetical protein
MKRTKIEAILAVIVVLTLALTAAVLGYLKGRSASAASLGVAGNAARAGVPESYAVPQQIPVLCFHGIGTPSPVSGSVDNYNTTLDNFKAEMAYLYGQGYARATPRSPRSSTPTGWTV